MKKFALKFILFIFPFLAAIGIELFIKTTPENPVLWTGMKGVSAKGRWNMI
jgi:hypothetical protein